MAFCISMAGISFAQKLTPSPAVDSDSFDENSMMPITTVVTGLGDDQVTLVTFRYATTLFKPWIRLDSKTFLTVGNSAKQYQILDWGLVTDDEDELFSSLNFGEQYYIKRRISYNLYMVFPKIPETATVLNIQEPTKDGFFWRGIHINNATTEDLSRDSQSNYASKGEFTPSSSGTGFAISADGYVATCNHVIANARTIRIKGINGDFNKAHVAKVVVRDEDKDLAILKIDNVRIADVPYSLGATQSEVGEEVFVLGYPQTQRLGEELKLTTGVISSRSGYRGDVTTYQISAQVLPGNSGCPLFDNEGRIIGVVNAKYIEPNVSYAVKLPYLKTLIERTQISLRQPVGNAFSGKTLAEKVKAVRNYIYIIEVQ